MLKEEILTQQEASDVINRALALEEIFDEVEYPKEDEILVREVYKTGLELGATEPNLDKALEEWRGETTSGNLHIGDGSKATPVTGTVISETRYNDMGGSLYVLKIKVPSGEEKKFRIYKDVKRLDPKFSAGDTVRVDARMDHIYEDLFDRFDVFDVNNAGVHVMERTTPTSNIRIHQKDNRPVYEFTKLNKSKN